MSNDNNVILTFSADHPDAFFTCRNNIDRGDFMDCK